jgi:uncharacterized membrane protein YbhN (UPF0104 family)
MKMMAIFGLIVFLSLVAIFLIMNVGKESLADTIDEIKNSPVRQIILGTFWTIPIWVYLLFFR